MLCSLQRLHSCPDLVSFMMELKTVLVSDRIWMWEVGCSYSLGFRFQFCYSLLFDRWICDFVKKT